MREISQWLEKLGMSEYAPRFSENDIDFAILPDLTDQDLEKIGVASLGHRRKLLRAIAALDGVAAASPAAPVSLSVALESARAKAPTASATEAVGERRYLTVMFCDLVGSTGISAQLDAEEWRDLVGSYLDAASAAVTNMGGHVAKKLGDGLMALFGYPLAHENDAERAARAALAIQRALTELNRRMKAAATRFSPRALASKPVQRWSMQRARFTATWPTSRPGCSPSPMQARFWSRRECSARSPGCLWRRSAACTR